MINVIKRIFDQSNAPQRPHNLTLRNKHFDVKFSRTQKNIHYTFSSTFILSLPANEFNARTRGMHIVE